MKRGISALSAVCAVILAISCDKEEQPKTIDGHEYVDLGLPSGLLWATCNLGASKPEESGDYYGWGMIEPYKTADNADWSTYFSKIGSNGTSKDDCGTDKDPIKDYVYGGSKYSDALDAGQADGISGTQWDAVRQNWKGEWRMPTKAELIELLYTSDCQRAWTVLNGVKGVRITSNKNGNSIFLPAAGSHDGPSVIDGECLYMWPSTPYNDYPYRGHLLNYDSIGQVWSFADRYCGLSLRPVIMPRK
ncbi:MAG: hypothetical protein HUJ94_02520 [Bacteroidales bacterium]|nr:hypothetical protein [Bacteroidales bacterium]